MGDNYKKFGERKQKENSQEWGKLKDDKEFDPNLEQKESKIDKAKRKVKNKASKIANEKGGKIAKNLAKKGMEVAFNSVTGGNGKAAASAVVSAVEVGKEGYKEAVERDKHVGPLAAKRGEGFNNEMEELVYTEGSSKKSAKYNRSNSDESKPKDAAIDAGEGLQNPSLSAFSYAVDASQQKSAAKMFGKGVELGLRVGLSVATTAVGVASGGVAGAVTGSLSSNAAKAGGKMATKVAEKTGEVLDERRDKQSYQQLEGDIRGPFPEIETMTRNTSGKSDLEKKLDHVNTRTLDGFLSRSNSQESGSLETGSVAAISRDDSSVSSADAVQEDKSSEGSKR